MKIEIEFLRVSVHVSGICKICKQEIFTQIDPEIFTGKNNDAVIKRAAEILIEQHICSKANG